VVRLPIVRKIINVGKSSRGIILPKSWLDFLKEENQGQLIEVVAIEVTNVLRVSPIFKKVTEVPNE
jgi:hypothetical protein